jgi:hypothetical protein
MPTVLVAPLIIVHVALALSLFVPSLLLPFALRPRLWGGGETAPEDRGRFIRALLWVQSHGTAPLGLGLAITGFALVVTLGLSLLQQPWLLVALAIYALDLGLAFFVQRPGFRHLASLRRQDDSRALVTGARRQRYVSYVMAGLIGTIGFLMSTKPVLW